MNGNTSQSEVDRPVYNPGQNHSLHGKRVVITRAESQSAEIEKLLRRYGAAPVLYPCIEILPAPDSRALDNALTEAANNGFEWLVVTSANTVEALAERLRVLRVTLGDLKIAAIGSKTARAVGEKLDRDVDFTATKYVAETLSEELDVGPGQRILLPQSEIARPMLAEKLAEKHAVVKTVVAYRVVKGQGGDDVPLMLASRHIEAITFTSASTVHYFLVRLDEAGADLRDLEGICLAAIGPIAAAALEDASLKVSVIPGKYTVPDLVEALEKYFNQVM